VWIVLGLIGDRIHGIVNQYLDSQTGAFIAALRFMWGLLVPSDTGALGPCLRRHPDEKAGTRRGSTIPATTDGSILCRSVGDGQGHWGSRKSALHQNLYRARGSRGSEEEKCLTLVGTCAGFKPPRCRVAPRRAVVSAAQDRASTDGVARRTVAGSDSEPPCR
jgi:hypothetical protein